MKEESGTSHAIIKTPNPPWAKLHLKYI